MLLQMEVTVLDQLRHRLDGIPAVDADALGNGPIRRPAGKLVSIEIPDQETRDTRGAVAKLAVCERLSAPGLSPRLKAIWLRLRLRLGEIGES